MNEPTTENQPAMMFEGCVDDITRGTLSGWAAEAGSDEACGVEVVGPAGFYTRAVADLYRADLDAAGKRGGNCRFVVSINSPGHQNFPDFAVVLAGRPDRLRHNGDPSVAAIEG